MDTGTAGEVAQVGSGVTCLDADPTYVWLRPVGGGHERPAQIDDLEPA
ncbi:hypothetical protein ACIBEA_14475 [Streptomyces sp. NPDC051555]